MTKRKPKAGWPVTVRRAAELKDCSHGAIQAAVKRGDLRMVQVGETEEGKPVELVDRVSLSKWAPRQWGGKR